ncbi:MAG: helix-turn-helix domain-containing protein [Pseudomonadota bacterium]
MAERSRKAGLAEDAAAVGEPGTQEAEDFDWSNDVSTFGDRLARARDFAQMDQSTLARRLGVKLATIRNWEADRSEPRANKLQTLSGLLNISIIWLMTGEGEGVPELDADQAGQSADIRAILEELRSLRVAQAQLAERTGRIEKRLRSLMTQGD